jgi:hypothetical protein
VFVLIFKRKPCPCRPTAHHVVSVAIHQSIQSKERKSTIAAALCTILDNKWGEDSGAVTDLRSLCATSIWPPWPSSPRGATSPVQLPGPRRGRGGFPAKRTDSTPHFWNDRSWKEKKPKKITNLYCLILVSTRIRAKKTRISVVDHHSLKALYP